MTRTRASAAIALTLTLLLAACGGEEAPETAPGAPGAPAGSAAGSEWDITYFALEAIDASTAFAVGAVEGKDRSVVVKTADGGANWAAVLRLEDAEVVGIDFVDAQNGALITTGGAVLVTGDGGLSWRSASGTPLAPRLAQGADVAINGLAAAGSSAWAVGAREGEDGTRPVLFTSKDAGATWKEAKLDASLPGVALTRVAFADERTGVIVGGEPDDDEIELLLATSDGGATWQRVASKTAQSPTSAAFVGPQRGWLVGRTEDEATADPGPSAIYVTEDGGRTWTAQKKLPVSLHAVRFADATHGWAVGASSRIYGTADGGATWVEQTAQDRASGQELKAAEPASANAADAPTFLGLVMLSPDRGLAPSDRGVFEVRIR